MFSLKNFQFRVRCGVHICVPITHETEVRKLNLGPAWIMQLDLISRNQASSVQRRAPQTKICNRCPNRKDVCIFLTTVQVSTKTQRKGKRSKGRGEGTGRTTEKEDGETSAHRAARSTLPRKLNYIKVFESHQS